MERNENMYLAEGELYVKRNVKFLGAGLNSILIYDVDPPEMEHGALGTITRRDGKWIACWWVDVPDGSDESGNNDPEYYKDAYEETEEFIECLKN